MKSLIVILALLVLTVPAFARNNDVQMTCTNATDCAIRIQYATDLQALQTAQDTLATDLATLQTDQAAVVTDNGKVTADNTAITAAQKSIDADVANYNKTVVQAAIIAQLSEDQNTLSGLKTLGGAVSK